MKIIVAANERLHSRSAATVQLTKVTQAFQEIGNDVRLLLPAFPNVDADAESVRLQYGLRNRLDIRLIKGLSAQRHHDRNIRYAGIARRWRADLVYTIAPSVAAWCSLRGIPTLYEVHDVQSDWKHWPFIQSFLRLPGYRGLVTISQSLKQKMLEAIPRVQENEVLVEHDGVDLDQFRERIAPEVARAKLGLPTDVYTVGYTGHLYEGRGIELILSIAAASPEIQFVIVGGEDAAIEHWKRKSSERGIPNINFTGYRPNHQIPDYLAACETLLMPYQRRVCVYGGGGNTSAVMSPMKMFEYLASGRMIVSSDLPVLREVLNESNAILCHPESVDEWTAAIRKGLTDPSRRFALGRQAATDAEYFDWRARARRILGHFQLATSSEKARTAQRAA